MADKTRLNAAVPMQPSDDPATKPAASRSVFGVMPDGSAIEAVTLRAGGGVSACIITLGASLQSLILQDRHGQLADVVLGHATLDEYLAKPQYFGATIGRFANRLAGGRVTIAGKICQLPLNGGQHSLHGGTRGFDAVAWTIVDVQALPEPRVIMQYASPDGDQGYPGRLLVTATYTLTRGNELVIDYRASTDRTTIGNRTNHTYWNLAGEGSGSVAQHELTILSDRVAVVDSTLVPTGELRAVAGGPFDFRHGKPLGRDIDDPDEPLLGQCMGYDLSWVTGLNKPTRLRRVARLDEPRSGRSLTLRSQQPAMQLDTGNFLDGTSKGKSGRFYHRHDAVSLEPQRLPDTPHHPDFGSALLQPGQSYRNLIVYRFAVS
jgi:aldose 1-epimerase